MADLIFMDIGHDNIGESIYVNGVPTYEVMHEFNFEKAIAQGVDGALIRVGQGTGLDAGYKIISDACKLPYQGDWLYLDYCRTHYVIGNEVAWGKKQAQIMLDASAKYNHNVRVAIDGEQNAKWEKLENTEASNFALDRWLKINMAMVEEINRLAGYLPLEYTNGTLTKYMKDFIDCPLWIADPEPGEPHFSNWADYAIHQFTWTANGQLYGNYIGNPSIDLNRVKNLQAILKPGAVIVPPIENPLTVLFKAKNISVYPLTTHTSASFTAPDFGKDVLVGEVVNVYRELNGLWLIDPVAQRWLTASTTYMAKVEDVPAPLPIPEPSPVAFTPLIKAQHDVMWKYFSEAHPTVKAE